MKNKYKAKIVIPSVGSIPYIHVVEFNNIKVSDTNGRWLKGFLSDSSEQETLVAIVPTNCLITIYENK